MQKRLRKKFVVLTWLIFNFQFLSFNYLSFSQVHPESGTTSAGFLKIPVGARATAMGGYYAMFGDDVSLLYWNPSGISDTKSSKIEFSHKEYFQGLKHDFLGYVLPTKTAVLGFAITSFFVDSIEGRSGVLDMDNAYVNLYQVTPVEYYFGIFDLAVSGSYIKKVSEKISLGANIKFVSQKIDTYSGYSFGLDLGCNVNLKKNLYLGAVVKNFGFPIKLDKESYNLPLEFGLGVFYNYRNINFVFNLSQPIDNYMISNVGIEYNVLKNIFLRAGYKYRLYGWELGNEAGVATGIGFNFYGTKLDYGIISYGALGVIHNISLGIDFREFSDIYKNIRKNFGSLSLQKKEQEMILKEKQKVEVLKPVASIALKPVNENMYKELYKKQYSVKTKNNLLSYDSANKIYKYSFSTIETLNLDFDDGKELVLEKVEGKIFSKNKFDIEKENYITINSSMIDNGLDTMLPQGQKVLQLVEVGKYFGSEILSLELHFSTTNYDKLYFYVIDKNLQKVEPEIVNTENGVKYKINILKNLKVVISK